MPSIPLSVLLLTGAVLLFATPAVAFGAGNIVSVSQVAGKNWRHGDIEETLLELFMSQAGNKKFDRLNVKRVYFGNWLRDYSQAIDVGGLKQLPKDAIRVLLWVLSFMTFGFATGEFEVTEERLGTYRPEEHIDNPKDYADNEDARKYDPRLRGPVDEGKELAIDERTGLKAYIASEDRGMDTSAGLVRKKFEEAIEKGRAYGRDGRDVDLYEALRLLGTGLHCLEDYAAHSNYCELALRELGPQIYPHVGERTEIEVNGKRVFPVITGTFGMTDFLHSVLGEVSDKMVQSEVQDLDSKLSNASDPNKSNEATSTLKGILDNVPWALLGIGGDFGSEADRLQQDANAKKMEQTSIRPKTDVAGYDVEEMKRQTEQTVKDIFPILEFHDKVMKAFQAGIDKIPGATALLENLTGAMQIYVFSILAPYVKPILERTKAELAAGSGGVLAASERAQFKVFEDENCSDPTHSVLSKDHFTNILNPVAGRVASATVSFAVPLIVSAWDDSNRDPRQIIDEILQVFHHPALRDENKAGQRAMFEAVKQWWEEKDESQKRHLEEALGKEGVKNGKNHEGEDPNPGPGGCGHSHKGMPGGGGVASYSSGNQQSRPGGGEGSSYGGSHKESSYGSSGRNREEASSYDNTGGGYGSGRNNNESSYNRSGGRDSDNRQQSSYGSGSNRQETSSYGGTGTSHSSRHQKEESSSYGSSRRDNDSYGAAGGGYGSNAQDSYGSSGRRDNDTYGTASGGYGSNTQGSSYGSSGRRDNDTYGTARGGHGSNTQGSSYSSSGRRDNDTYGATSGGYGSSTQDSYGSSDRRGNDDGGTTGSYGRAETSSYGGDSGAGRSKYDNESPSHPRGSGENTSSYGREEQPLSYGRAGSSEGVTSYGRSSRTEEGSSYGTSGRDQDTSSYGRSGRGEETSSYGRSNRDNDNSSSSYRGNTSSYDNDNTTSSYGTSGRGEGTTTTSTYGRSSRNDGNEESSYESTSRSYGSRDNDTSEYGSSRRTGDDEGQSYGRRGGNRRGNEEESSGYGY